MVNVEHLKSKFARMGAKVKVGALAPDRRSWDPVRRTWGASRSFAVDVEKEKKGVAFSVRTLPGAEVQVQVLQVEPRDRHLILMVKEATGRPAEPWAIHRFLCGHDERAWFVAAVPGPASTVDAAKEALKPATVLATEYRVHVKSTARNKRRNAAFVRQGEWFFVPCPGFSPDPLLILRNEPVQRGGRPHVVEFLYRARGERVYVNAQHPNGLAEREYRKLVHAHPKMRRAGWRIMVRDAEVYAKGRVRHPDHKTIVLPTWHRVLPNTETEAPSMRHVTFLD